MVKQTIIFTIILLALIVPVANAAPPGPQIDQEQPAWVAGLFFGTWDGTSEVAQTFTPSANKSLCQITVALFDTFNASGPAPAVIAELWSDGGSQPGALLGTATNTISADVSNSYLTDYAFSFDGPRLRRGATYWLVLRSTIPSTEWPFGIGWMHDAVDPYVAGQFWRLTDGAWTPENWWSGYGDMRFSEYTCNGR
jgi:hypothetical protein